MNSIVLFAPEYRKGSAFVEKIQQVAEGKQLDFSVVYVSKNVNPLQQQQFLYAVHIADVVIVDCTIPQDENDGSVYPALTAQINIYNHIIVVSENNLPLNITPYRGVYPKEDGKTLTTEQILAGLPMQIDASLEEDTYKRLPEDMYEDFMKYQIDMEKMIHDSLDCRKKKSNDRIPVMISYRNSHSKEVELFRNIVENTDKECEQKRFSMGLSGKYEVKVLPPASLCGADEAHTPMRRWMLVGLLEDTIREVDEVWVYESHDANGEIDYTKSWWTIAEMIMVANLNHSSAKKIKVKVFNPATQTFYEKTPEQYLVRLSEEQHKRLARYLSNTRPDTMGPECLEQVKQLKQIARLMRFATKDMKEQMIENLRNSFEQSVPKTIEPEDRKKMIDDMIDMYSDPDKIIAYTNDDVFKENFWEKISYQTSDTTGCFVDGKIDVDKFMAIPMEEVTGCRIEDFEEACQSDGKINLGSWICPKTYNVSKAAVDRYLWLATRMGRATVKGNNAPGLERIRVYNIK